MNRAGMILFALLGLGVGFASTWAAGARGATGMSTSTAPALVKVSVVPQVLPADGTSQAAVTVKVVTADETPVPDGTQVRLSATGGSIQQVAVTLGGEIVVPFTAGTAPGTVTIRATAGDVTGQADVRLVAPTDPVSLTVAADPATLLADGVSTATVTVQVFTIFGAPVPDGTTVHLTATNGSIPATAVTTDGKVVVTYTAGTQPGIVTVTAKAGEVAGQTEIRLERPTEPARLTIAADPATLPADGVSTATVTVQVFTVLGDPVPNGTAVHLTATNGSIPATAATTGGKVVVTYTAGTTPGAVTVTARAGNASGSFTIALREPPVVVEGRVEAPSGAEIPHDTRVELRDESDQVVASALVAADARFRLESNRRGVFDAVLWAPGFVPLRVRGVDLRQAPQAEAPHIRFPLLPQPELGRGLELMTIPFRFRDGAPETVLGDPHAVLHCYDPEAGRYRTLGIDPFPVVETGRGFWLRPRRGSAPYRIEAPADLPIEGQPEVVPLARGWQIVGNPFPADVSVGNVQVLLPGAAAPVPLGHPSTARKVRGYLWGWNGTRYELVAPDEGSSTLKAYGGYWVRSLVDGAKLVFLPPRELAPAGQASRRAPADGWRAQIQVGTARGASGTVTLGVGREARAIEAPPAPDGQVEARFLTPNGERLAVAVHRQEETRAVWRLEVTGPDAEEEVTLTWPDLGRVARRLHLVLVDEQTGERRSMRTTTGIRCRLGDGPRRYRIEAQPAPGTPLVITGIEVTATRGGGRNITYTLSAAAEATVEIVSPSGAVIRRVAVATEAAAGSNQAYWDGRDGRGVAVGGGVVLVRVTATDAAGTTVHAVRPVAMVR